MMPLARLAGGRSGAGVADYSAFTKLLLHCDGTDGSTTFADSSASAHTVTAIGNAQIDTAQSKFGGSSLLCQGTSDGASLNGHADFTYGTGDAVIEAWVRLAVTGSLRILYDGRPADAGVSTYPLIFLNASNQLVFHDGQGARITGATSLSAAVWRHWAWVKSSGQSKLFLGGVQEGSTYADSNNYLGGGSGRPTIGVHNDGVSFSLDGWLDEIRVLKGSNGGMFNGFAPPTQPYS